MRIEVIKKGLELGLIKKSVDKSEGYKLLVPNNYNVTDEWEELEEYVNKGKVEVKGE